MRRPVVVEYVSNSGQISQKVFGGQFNHQIEMQEHQVTRPDIVDYCSSDGSAFQIAFDVLGASSSSRLARN